MNKAVQFSNTFRYIEDLFSVNSEHFGHYINAIYPSELELKDTTLTSNEVCYLDTRIKTGDSNTPFHLSVYDRRDEFSFRIVNFPYIDSNIPYIDFIDFHHVSSTKASNLRCLANCYLNSSNDTMLSLRSMVLHYGR